MTFIIRNAIVYDADGKFSEKDILVEDGRYFDLADDFADVSGVKEFHDLAVFPGLVDVHVHLREPGFSYKETIKTGTMAAAAGGYTHICTMPNLSPVPDSAENLEKQLEIIRRDAVIYVHPYGSITKGEKGTELSDMEAIAPDVIAFSDDGKGVQENAIMYGGMIEAKRLGKMIVAHCEDESLVNGGYVNDCLTARVLGYKGIPTRAEWQAAERDIELVHDSRCKYHMCHVSEPESLDLVRAAKSYGLDVTCETAPHYILLNDSYLLHQDARYKMNPPLRSETDREAVLRAVKDGTVDMIATDHAPHSAEEKSRPMAEAPMGIVGLETAFALLYTHIVLRPHITLDKLIELMSVNPRRRFCIDGDPGFTIFDLKEKYTIDSKKFLSMGRNTPFEGWEVYGKCLYTAVDGKVAYDAISEKI